MSSSINTTARKIWDQNHIFRLSPDGPNQSYSCLHLRDVHPQFMTCD
jgi:hypothetical protein